jgi:cation diffusion facilitator CzcD-associated flavoprotein CzcO
VAYRSNFSLTDWGYTEVALEKAIEDVHYAVYETPGVSNAATTFDTNSGEITTTVILANDGPITTVADLRARARESLETSAGPAVRCSAGNRRRRLGAADSRGR